MIATAGAGFVVGIDLGTSNTVAVIRSPDGRRRAVLFDGAPLMPSAVFLQPDGRLVVGRDAQRLAQLEPARFEPNPKRRIDEGTVLLADQEVPTVELLAAVFRAVGAAVGEVCPSLPPVVLTFPASWGQHRRQLLYDAASAGGWPQISLVPEPIAAAHYFISVFRQPVPSGATMAVFDFGGGTVDIAVVRYDGHAFAVLGSGGLQDLGGLDIDAALVENLGEILTQTAPDVWARLQRPVTAQDRRDRRLFWEDVRGAKEMLSRGTVAPVPIPGVEAALHITREELERLVGPLLHQAATETAAVVKRCGIEPRQLTWVLLVGGSSRVPLIARMLHTELGVAPTVLEQPELPVAEGALVDTAELGIDGLGAADPTGDGEARRGYFTDDAAFAGPTSLGPAYSGAPWYQVGDVVMGDRPVSGSPVSGAPVSASPVSGSPAGPRRPQARRLARVRRPRRVPRRLPRPAFRLRRPLLPPLQLSAGLPVRHACRHRAWLNAIESNRSVRWQMPSRPHPPRSRPPHRGRSRRATTHSHPAIAAPNGGP
jgi:Hsp70 protein